MTAHTAGPRRSLTLATLALASALTLAACGGEETTVAPSPETQTTTAAPTTTEAPTTESADTATTETETAESASSESASADASAGDVPQVDVTWPAGWTDLSELVGDGLPDTAQIYGHPDFMTNAATATVFVHPAGTVPADDYLRVIEMQGFDVAAAEELPAREISGQQVPGYRLEIDTAGQSATLIGYGLYLDDGTLVEIAFNSLSANLPEVEQDFEAILDSIQVTQG